MEKYLVTRCKNYAKRNNWFYLKLSDKSTLGIPDSFFLKGGRSIWIEFKSPDDKRKNSLQKWTIEQISKHGGEAYFGVSSFEIFKLIIDNTYTQI